MALARYLTIVEGKENDIDNFFCIINKEIQRINEDKLETFLENRINESKLVIGFEETPDLALGLLEFLTKLSETMPDSSITLWVEDEAPYNYSWEFKIQDGNKIEICHNEELLEERKRLGESEPIV